MEQLRKSLNKYFTYLDKHSLLWEELIKKAERPLEGLRNQSEQLRLVLRVKGEDVELLKFPSLKQRLISKIKTGLESEITLLLANLDEISSANGELKKRLAVVEHGSERLPSKSSLYQSSATQPSVAKMLEWAEESWRYYHAHYLRMTNTLKLLDYENEDSVLAFSRSFQEDRDQKNHIQKILAYTQYFVKDL